MASYVRDNGEDGMEWLTSSASLRQAHSRTEAREGIYKGKFGMNLSYACINLLCISFSRESRGEEEIAPQWTLIGGGDARSVGRLI
jgi:hypothetical protein